MIAPLILLAAIAATDTPAPVAAPAQPPEPVTLDLPDCTPEIIPPFGNSPAAHNQARTASKIVLETAREAPDAPDTEDGADPESPSSRSD